jgi:SNF2 family DNA or RNA helicase
VSVAEVCLRPDRTGVEIVPVHGTAVNLVRELRGRHSDLRVRVTRDRLQVTFADAALLLAAEAGLRWAADAERTVENRRRAHQNAPTVMAEAARLRGTSPDELRACLPQTSSLKVLDDHQLLNVALMTIPGGWGTCIFDEQGTGKTPTVIAAFDTLIERNEADILLVISPKSMVGEWGQEFRRFTGDLYRIAAIEGSRERRASSLASGADVVVVNYEGTIALFDDLRLLAIRSRVVMVVDESFNVKNRDATRTAAVADLREWCVRCFALCGTPAPNSPRDIVAQVDLVDFGMTFDGVVPQDEPEGDRAAIATALQDRGLYSRNLKHEVLPDLPDKQFAEVRVEFEPQQRWLYAQALDGLIHDLKEVDDTEYERRRVAFAERRSTLLRLCSHPAAVFASYTGTPAKVSALDELLAEPIGRGEKVVLWSFYRYTLDFLAQRYAHYGVARIDGSITEVAARRDAVRRFQEDDETMVFLGNPAAAGAGLTLHRSALAIYESFSNQAAHFMQSLDRIHRRGQERDVEYLVLLCDGSVEEFEYERILRKVDLQADLLGDPEPYRPTREVMLSELLATRQGLETIR